MVQGIPLLCKPNTQNVCSATAQDVRTMIIGRLLAGIGIGIDLTFQMSLLQTQREGMYEKVLKLQ